MIGIRKEDGHACERRTPIVPDDVRELISRGISVLVQPSKLRIFTDKEYSNAGAVITEDLSSASVIFGLKAIPVGSWLPQKTYAIFSHTHKSQKENMPSLREALSKKCRIIDYEFVREGTEPSLVKFSRWAGITGAIQGLHALGLKIISMGYSNPFLSVSSSQCYSSYKDVVATTQSAVNAWVSNSTLTDDLGPLIVGITGTGNVACGAKQFLIDSGFKIIEYNRISQCEATSAYCVIFPITSTLVMRENASAEFSQQDCYSSPEKFDSIFVERFISKLSLFINAVYWEAPMPRLVPTKDLPFIIKSGRPYVISDVSCDIEGSIEFLKSGMNIFRSWQLYNVDGNPVYSAVGNESNLIAVTAIDNLPSLFARQASIDFSRDLLKFVSSILSVDISESYTDLPHSVAGSVICDNGKLTAKFDSIKV